MTGNSLSMFRHSVLIMGREDVQGTRTKPLVSSLILLLLSCILIQLSLNSDWASMSGEVEYTADDREYADFFDVELPDISMAVSFGLTDMTTSVSNNDEKMEETAKLEEINDGREYGQYLDMDWDEWYSAGKTTSIALWIGFIAAILGTIMTLIGAFKANDTAHGSGIILCGLAASLINVGWFNWIMYGGNFADEIPGGDGWATDGFGVSTGFIMCMVAGVFLLVVPFILARSQELPINKLLPLKGGYAELEMRHYQPSMRLNTTIIIMLASLLVLSGVGQGVASAYFYSDIPQSSDKYDDDTETNQQVLIPWISIGVEGEYHWLEPIEGSLGDGDSVSFLFFEGGKEKVPSWQRFEIHIICDDGGNGETGAPNAQEEEDTLHWKISANNGQELIGSLDCDGSNNAFLMLNEGNDDFDNWFDGTPNCQDLIFHDEDDADSCVETAPLNKNMFPISLEFTAETRGDTLDQNQDKELEFRSQSLSNTCQDPCHVLKRTWHVEYDTFWAPEDYREHEHYNSSS